MDVRVGLGMHGVSLDLGLGSGVDVCVSMRDLNRRSTRACMVRYSLPMRLRPRIRLSTTQHT